MPPKPHKKSCRWGFFFLGAARPRRPAIFSHACWRGLRPYTRGSVPAGFGLLRSGLLVSPGAADLPHRIKAVLFFVRVQQRRRKLKAAARECVARHRAMPKGRGCRGVGDALSSPPFRACVWVLGSPFGARAAFLLYDILGVRVCVICVEAVWTRKNKNGVAPGVTSHRTSPITGRLYSSGRRFRARNRGSFV